MAENRHVLGLSGGKDSAALAVYMRTHYPEIEIEYYFSDTGKELPEVYEFLGKLEGFLGKEIVRLNSQRDFDFWLQQYNNFLPSPRTRWCTNQLKIKPFEKWIEPTLAQGGTVTSYVAIRKDEDNRKGYVPTKKGVCVKFPFIEDGLNKPDVLRILEDSGIGLPRYYQWRSRSGCTFCFFQQKIEWVGLLRNHPEAFNAAKAYEKTALTHGSKFTWADGETLEELENPNRVADIELDFKKRKERELNAAPRNVLLPSGSFDDLDEMFLEDEGRGACLVCYK